MLKDQTICQFLGIKVEADNPFRCYHGGYEVYYETSDGVWERREYNSRGYVTYYEDSDGYWEKKEYDSKDREIYRENSTGDTTDNRPKEPSMKVGGGRTLNVTHNCYEAYFECFDGRWIMKEYDAEGNVTYYECSDEYIEDNPRELTFDEITEKFGIPVERLKIKK